MAILLSALSQIYAETTAAQVNLLPLFPQLWDRSHDAAILKGGAVKIPNPTYGAVPLRPTLKGEAWEMPTKGDARLH